MKNRCFGLTDHTVSPIGFGAAAISGEGGGYGFGHITEDAAIALVRSAQDSGINLFDTAPIYGFGLSEKRLGRALSGHRRDGAIVVSKCGIAWDDRKRVRIDNRAETTQLMLEQSLRDLAMDYIDLYMVHWPDPQVDIRRTMEYLVRAQESGKIKAIGLSNTSVEDLEKAQEVGVVAVCQGEFSLFEPRYTGAFFDHIKGQGIGFMSWGTLAKGLLTGRVTEARKFDEKDVRSSAPWWTQTDHRCHYQTMERLLPLLNDNGHTGLELALSHVLDHDAVSTALCGARSIEQMAGLLAATDNLLTPDLLAECRRITAEVFADPDEAE